MNPSISQPQRQDTERTLGGLQYFHKGIDPEPLRTLFIHFRVEYVYDLFDQFRLQYTASVVEMVNLKTTNSRPRDRHFYQRLQQIPEPRALGGERRAKKTDSAGTKTIALSEDPLLQNFDCDNCRGTHKSMNYKSACRLCKSKGGLEDDRIQCHCPNIINAADRKRSQLPRPATGSPKRSVKSATSGSKRSGGSDVSATTQDDENYAEEDSEVNDYPVYVDTCASDIYIPTEKHLDADSYSLQGYGSA